MIYALLIHDARAENDPLPAALEEAMLERHRALQRQCEERDELRAVARLVGPSAARSVRRDDDESIAIADGPYLETKEWLVGFYLLDCESEAEALARAEQICPPGGGIEVRPVRWERVPSAARPERA